MDSLDWAGGVVHDLNNWSGSIRRAGGVQVGRAGQGRVGSPAPAGREGKKKAGARTTVG